MVKTDLEKATEKIEEQQRTIDHLQGRLKIRVEALCSIKKIVDNNDSIQLIRSVVKIALEK